MVRFAIGLLMGAASVGWLPALPPRAWVWALFLPAIALARFPRALLLAGVCAGLALALLAASERRAQTLAPALEGADLVLVGRITGLPTEQGRRTRFRLAVERARVDGRPVDFDATVRLNWYGPERPALVPGERWRLQARLHRPRGFANPGTFDYARWLFREGIAATGYVRAPATAQRLSAGGYSLDRLRHALRAELRAHLPREGPRGILLALAMGEREAITPDDWALLRTTGTTHLVAISGLHIGLLALAGYWFGALCWLGLGPLRQRVPRPLVQVWLGLAAAAGYAALAGFALPTLRALIMLTVALAAIVLRRRARPLEGLAAAAIAVIAFDPLAPLGASFWLSFGAVAAILLLVVGRTGVSTRLRRWLGLQLGITLALTPILLGAFGQASLIAPLANAIAIPWVSLLVVPPTLLATALVEVWPPAAEGLFRLALAVLDPLWHLLRALADWPGADWHAPQPPLWLVALAAGGAGLLLLPRGTPGRAAGALAVLVLLLWQPAGPERGAVWLRLLDVGQGLAAVVRTQGHVLVYDTGARFSQTFDAGSAVVVPFLRSRGVERVDRLVISHTDNDHAGGRHAVIEEFDPGVIDTSAPQELNRRARLCRRGQAWQWDGVRFRYLHPDPDDALDANNGSCVLRIDAPGGSLLLPGDIEAPAERRLLARGAELRADAVVAPHHGSASSSTPAFVAAVDADWVFYPVGHDNRWDFPAAAVRRRWVPAAQLGTDCAGAIRLRIHPQEGITGASGWRQERARFWQSGCARATKSGTMRAGNGRARRRAEGG